ncbi:MAG: hypothetical protein DME22_17210 [Verrucomicrobia bacterium]|nr:MAG: hypothetical protein DME22_17210 [Verrucomicrobiota bacterium]
MATLSILSKTYTRANSLSPNSSASMPARESFQTSRGCMRDQVNAIIKGGLWANSVIFITWDDWGGWFDHVDPPNVEPWTDGTQFRYGSRVGCLVLSPYAKRGYISKALHSHVSLLKFCETTFGLSALTKRDAAADDMSDCFDFQQPPAPPPASHPA